MADPRDPGLAAKLLGKANDMRVRGRGALAEIAGLFGGEGQDLSSQAGMHRVVSRNLTQDLGQVLPPQMSANLADTAGLGNETLSGGLQALLGNPVMSETGFDWGDVASNRGGQDAAMKELRTHPPLGAQLLRPITDPVERVLTRIQR